MTELFAEIYKNSTLNRNVSTLIEQYLLDPPVLPFLEELGKQTRMVNYYCTHNWFYNDYMINGGTGHINGSVKYYSAYFGWSLR
jgi:hypothetical protein